MPEANEKAPQEIFDKTLEDELLAKAETGLVDEGQVAAIREAAAGITAFSDDPRFDAIEVVSKVINPPEVHEERMAALRARREKIKQG